MHNHHYHPLRTRAECIVAIILAIILLVTCFLVLRKQNESLETSADDPEETTFLEK